MLMIKQSEQGSISVWLAVIFGLLFVASSVFGLWAFSERQSYKNNVDEKIEDAVAVAVQAAETRKDAEFVEKEKSPVRTYVGPEIYGKLSFDYPKTWSVYVDENSSGTVLDLYAYPGVLPELKTDVPYALRVEIVSNSYDQEVERLNKSIENGKLTTTAFRPAKNNNVLGIRADGDLGEERQASLVLLPLRDRTIKIYAETQEFIKDFNTYILPSLSYQP